MGRRSDLPAGQRRLRLLLDTHTLVWWLTNERKLSVSAVATMRRKDAAIVVSAVSAFEIATKVRLGKFEEAREIDARFLELVEAEEFSMLPITIHHALVAGHFAAAHGDPFDRLLAAQSLVENLTLVTRDPAFATFGVTTLW